MAECRVCGGEIVEVSHWEYKPVGNNKYDESGRLPLSVITKQVKSVDHYYCSECGLMYKFVKK